MLGLPKLQSHVGGYIKQINGEISNLTQPDFINPIAQTIISQGKRVRPIILILIAKLLGAKDEKSLIAAGTGIELIHLASLLHDDVVDQSDFRHNEKTAHIIFGNQQTILAGDFLFAESFKTMVQLGNLEILKIISDTSSILASGELIQLQMKNKVFELDLPVYYDVIYKKTASLFEAAAKIGSHLSNPTFASKVGEFGKSIGMAFQIIDDLLDYTSTESKKKIGADFYEGKITLPIIFANSTSSKLSKAEKISLRTLFLETEKTAEHFANALSITEKSGAFEFCKNSALEFCTSAKNIINEIGGKTAEGSLILEIIDFLIERKF